MEGKFHLSRALSDRAHAVGSSRKKMIDQAQGWWAIVLTSNSYTNHQTLPGGSEWSENVMRAWSRALASRVFFSCARCSSRAQSTARRSLHVNSSGKPL